jgi:hypothetical protein
MPEYIYKNPNTDETVSVIQSVHDEHVYSENGVQFERVFLPVSNSIGSKQDGSYESFKKATSGKKLSLGDAWDISKESSEKRKSSQGRDEVKTSYFNDYSQKRQGKKHIQDN